MSQPLVYPAILAVLAEIGHIAKDSTNTQQGFKFRGIEAVYTALAPLLKKHGLFVSPEVLSANYEERVTKSGGTMIYARLMVAYNFVASDGSTHRVVVQGEGMDSGDKATPKALSAAFKYCCFQTFCIPVADIPDADAHTPEPSARAPKMMPLEAEADLLSATDLAELKERFDFWAAQSKAEGWPAALVNLKDKVKAKLLPK
jgi:hypothetical protein